MDLQSYLVSKFESWCPPPPLVQGRSKSDITLRWEASPFDFLEEDLLYCVQKKEKLPPWVVVYSGGKSTKIIDNLPPRHPHKFRLKVILKVTAVPTLADKACKFFGDERTIYEFFKRYEESETQTKDDRVDNEQSHDKEDIATSNDEKLGNKNKDTDVIKQPNASENLSGSGDNIRTEQKNRNKRDVGGGDMAMYSTVQIISKTEEPVGKKWLESRWSAETATSTDTDGSSAVCFCMAVRCGYLKQIQVMLEERPALLEIINSNNGFTPLATAVRKGDVNTVKFLLAAGADVNAASTSGQTPLHLATLAARADLVDLLLDKGADFQARDLNGLRIEHYAVDSGRREMVAHALERGGDVHARDSNGWTPLFRAVTQGASAQLIELLVTAGSDVDAVDYGGLPLTSAARLLADRHGRARDSIMRLVDSHYPHEKAVANFTRLTKKISTLHSIFK